MNTINLFREIMQEDLQECRRVCPKGAISYGIKGKCESGKP
jgi:hypothetical protein